MRKVYDGVDHFDLENGLETRPGERRTYYADWELVQVLDEDRENVIVRMADTRTTAG